MNSHPADPPEPSEEVPSNLTRKSIIRRTRFEVVYTLVWVLLGTAFGIYLGYAAYHEIDVRGHSVADGSQGPKVLWIGMFALVVLVMAGGGLIGGVVSHASIEKTLDFLRSRWGKSGERKHESHLARIREHYSGQSSARLESTLRHLRKGQSLMRPRLRFAMIASTLLALVIGYAVAVNIADVTLRTLPVLLFLIAAGGIQWLGFGLPTLIDSIEYNRDEIEVIENLLKENLPDRSNGKSGRRRGAHSSDGEA